MRTDLVIDWLAFTFKPTYLVNEYGICSPIQEFKDMFPELNDIWQYTEVRNGRDFYNTRLIIGDDLIIKYNEISLDSTDKDFRMGVNIEVPAHSLSWFLGMFGFSSSFSDLRAFMRLLYDRACQLSRIDLCYDDYTKTYYPEDYLDWYRKDLLRTHFQKVSFYSDSKGGTTFYLGSLKKRDHLLRIYNKSVQSNGEKDCIRYEFENHHKYATDIQMVLATNQQLDFSSFFRSYVEVLHEDDPYVYSENRDRAALDDGWERFIDKDKFNEELDCLSLPEDDHKSRKDSYFYYAMHMLSVVKSLCCYVSYEQVLHMLQKSPISPRAQQLFNGEKLRNELLRDAFVSLSRSDKEEIDSFGWPSS